MHSNRFKDLLSVPAVGCVLVAWAVSLPGCGGEKPTAVVPDDQAAVAERNKSMEDYMKSKEGKAATKPQ